MKLLISLFCAFLSTTAFAQETRVVNGAPSNDPRILHLMIGDLHQCGVTKIAQHWALTAAHCVANFDVNVISLRGSSPFQNGNISQKFIHPEFQAGPPGVNDIALLYSSTGIPSETVNLATETPQVGTPVDAYGWGETSWGSGASQGQMTARQTVTDRAACAAELQASLGLGHLCAVGPNSLGRGDSGGPLFDGQYQVGLAVSTTTGYPLNRPNVYTSVAAYRDWIRSVMEGHSSRATIPDDGWYFNPAVPLTGWTIERRNGRIYLGVFYRGDWAVANLTESAGNQYVGQYQHCSTGTCLPGSTVTLQATGRRSIVVDGVQLEAFDKF